MAAPAYEREIELFRQHGGGLRMAEALRLGINRKTLYAMRDAGVVEPVSRGVYRLASLEPLTHPDLVTVAKRVPHGVLCLISALSFHELTTQVPHVIDVALKRGTRKPRLDYPPTRFFWFSGPAFHEGIETHELDGVPIRIYDPEKTLVDCFRYRKQIGMDVALEALRLWRERRKKKLDVLLKYARMRHVEQALRPYLAAERGLDIEHDPWTHALWADAHQSFALRRWVSENKFGPHRLVCRTPLTNIRITTFFAGEYEVRVVDPSRVELLAAIGCEVIAEG